MKSQDKRGFWGRMARSKSVGRLARDLAGPKAQADLLAACGYPGRPEGLAARLAVELDRNLPLATGRASMRSWSRQRDREAYIKARRAEALLAYPGPEPAELLPASQERPEPSLAEPLWPFASGQLLARIALAAHWSGRAELKQAALKQLAEFLEANPPLMGPCWADPALVACRALNWLLALRLLGDLSSLAAPQVAAALLHLQICGDYLSSFLAEEPGAAALAPAGGLFFLGCALGFMPAAPGWRRQAEAALGQALAAWQNQAGGVSGGGAAAACAWAGLCLWLGRQRGAEPPELAPALPALAGLCRLLAPPWGPGERFLPGEPRGPLALEPEGPTLAERAANLAAVLLDDPTVRASRPPDLALLLLWGEPVVESLRQLAGGRPPAALDSPALGLSLLAAQSKEHRLAAHLASGPRQEGQSGQGALGLALMVDGHRVCVLPPAGRGVLRLDGEPAGPGQASLLACSAGERHRFAAVALAGLGKPAHPVELRRRVLLDAERPMLTVVDQVLASAPHRWQFFFPLAPEVKARPTGDGGLLISGSFGQMFLGPDRRCEVSLLGGGDRPLVVRLDAASAADAEFSTAFTLRTGQGKGIRKVPR